MRMTINHLLSILRRISFDAFEDAETIGDLWVEDVRKKAEGFVEKVKRMILEAYHVPDLAGIGNLMLTGDGDIKLVDINNISRVSFDSAIPLDDRRYPVCDKSIEALSLLEQGLLKTTIQQHDPIYETYLESERMEEVKAMEKEFYQRLEAESTKPDISPS